MRKRILQLTILAAILLDGTILVLGFLGFGRPTIPSYAQFDTGARGASRTARANSVVA